MIYGKENERFGYLKDFSGLYFKSTECFARTRLVSKMEFYFNGEWLINVWFDEDGNIVDFEHKYTSEQTYALYAIEYVMNELGLEESNEGIRHLRYNTYVMIGGR